MHGVHRDARQTCSVRSKRINRPRHSTLHRPRPHPPPPLRPSPRPRAKACPLLVATRCISAMRSSSMATRGISLAIFRASSMRLTLSLVPGAHTSGTRVEHATARWACHFQPQSRCCRDHRLSFLQSGPVRCPPGLPYPRCSLP